MKDIIIGISLLWLIPFSIIILRIILYNFKLGILKDPENDFNNKKIKKEIEQIQDIDNLKIQLDLLSKKYLKLREKFYEKEFKEEGE